MTTITDKTSPNTPAPQPWLKPCLLDYGAVEDLTKGGVALGSPEGGFYTSAP